MEKTIVVNDAFQKGYTYRLTEPAGAHFAPNFKPELTPKEMLELGVFGGVYMRDSVHEFPQEWFEHACFQKEGVYTGDPSLNYFKVLASQSLAEWRKKGWIHPDDPRGWFQWYARYYYGRRMDDDRRQITRWVRMRRHVAQIAYSCERGDYECHKRQRQAVLHWAYDSRKL